MRKRKDFVFIAIVCASIFAFFECWAGPEAAGEPAPGKELVSTEVSLRDGKLQGLSAPDEWLDVRYVKRLPAAVETQEGWFLVRNSKYEGVKLPGEVTGVQAFEEGAAVVEEKSGQFGILFMEGTYIKLEDDVKDVATCSRGLFRIRNEAGKYGYLDYWGRLVIPCIYDRAELFLYGPIAEVSKDGKAGCIDPQGREIIPVKFQEVEVNRFNLRLHTARDNSGAYHIRIGGKPLYEQRYRAVEHFNPLGTAVVTLSDGKQAVILQNGRRLFNTTYVDIADGYSKSDIRREPIGKLVFRVKNNAGEFGFVNIYGEECVPCQYRDATVFRQGRAGVTKDGKKWGFVDDTGKVVIPFIYDHAEAYHWRMARVRRGTDEYFIDGNGRKIVRFSHDREWLMQTNIYGPDGGVIEAFIGYDEFADNQKTD